MCVYYLKIMFGQVQGTFLKLVFAACARRVYAIVFVSKTSEEKSNFAVS
jgi:nickel-dependent lactate racemase